MGRRKRQRWVVKAGSNVICSGGPLLIRAWMQQVAALRRGHSIEVIWVTSGAIALAAERTGFKKRGPPLAEKQALSAVGQPMVMDLYNLALHAMGLLGAQILLTYGDLADEGRRDNFKNTLEQILSWGMVPVINENDAVATEEIRFGDNDSLSARIARVVQADRLLLLTDVDGLHDRDPKQYPGARLIPRLSPAAAAEALGRLSRARRTPGRGAAAPRAATRGTGGIFSKMRAASEAAGAGIESWLVRGDLNQVLLQVAGNRSIGTVVGAAPGGLRARGWERGERGGRRGGKGGRIRARR